MSRKFDVSDPFSNKNLDIIFRLDVRYSNRIASRESSKLEFKENFNFGSLPKYARTMAAFSNNEGGYIVFGIGDNPRDLLGMSNDQFDKLEPERLTTELQKFFDPEIKWERYTYSYNDKLFGLIYTHECPVKPIISKQTVEQGEHIRESDIYYRYRAKNERIKYAELYAIIEERQTNNFQKWLDFIQTVAKIGVDNAAIIDLLEGTLSGPGGKLLISEKMIEKVKFIQEGRFDDTGGDPAIQVVAKAEVVDTNLIQPLMQVDKPVSINTPEIIYAFLDQKEVISPREYIKRMCYETSGYLPIYYFMKLSKISDNDVVNLLNSQSSRTQSRKKLLERITTTDKAGIKRVLVQHMRQE